MKEKRIGLSIKEDNKGFTLLEMTVCFALLGILLVAVAQVIASSSEVYYYTKSVSYGVQASQVIATEIRGDLEEAVIMNLSTSSGMDSVPAEALGKCVYIGSDGKSIYIINGNGEMVGYRLILDDSSSEGYILVRESSTVYDEYFEPAVSTGVAQKKYTSQYVGMNYTVRDIKFTRFTGTVPDSTKQPVKMPTGDYPVIILELTVYNPQYGEYVCTEFIPLYNFYGMNDTQLSSLIS